jgi:hypothetical protein
MFDTIFGLPMHVLLVHATVISLPAAALATIAVVARPAWRARFAPWVAVLNVAMLALTFVTVRSGLAFFNRLDQIEVARRHRDLGNILLWIVVAFAVASVVLWAVQRARQPILAAGVAALVVLLGGATAVQTLLVGHSGSTAVWKSTVDSTQAPSVRR